MRKYRTSPEATLIMKHLVSFSTDRPLEASAEFRIGVGSVPYLADHSFQDMVVLPGSFYIEMALCLDRELAKRDARLVRNAAFHNPIILSAEDTVIKVEAREHGDQRVEYTFYEASGKDSGSRAHATLLAQEAPHPVPTTIELRSADFSPPRSGPAQTAGSGLKSALLSCRNSLNSMAVHPDPLPALDVPVLL